MTRVLVLYALCTCILGSGCQLATLATRNVVFETCRVSQDCRERLQNKLLARRSWDSVRREHPGTPYSDEYAAGYQQGYADYLYAGGDGEPPLVPPKPWPNLGGPAADEFRAWEDWSAGFRHGAGDARASGQRERRLVPRRVPPLGEGSPVAVEPAAAARATPAEGELLPAPRVVPDEIVPQPSS